MASDIYFNNEFVDKMDKKIPEKIKTELKPFFAKIQGGHARFESDLLTSIYFSCFIKTHKYFYSKCIMKYAYVDNDFDFTDIYLVPKYYSDGKVKYSNSFVNDRLYEYRYDKNLDLNSIYAFHIPKNIKPENRIDSNVHSSSDIFCTKLQENGNPVNIKYYYPPTSQDFTDYCNYLEDKKIVVNNRTNNYFTGGRKGFFVKDLDDYNQVIYISFKTIDLSTSVNNHKKSGKYYHD